MDGHVDGRIGAAVDKSAHGGGIESRRLSRGQAGADHRSARLVLRDADHHHAAPGIGQGDAVADEFGLAVARQGFPVQSGFVIQSIGFDAAADDFPPVAAYDIFSFLHHQPRG